MMSSSESSSTHPNDGSGDSDENDDDDDNSSSEGVDDNLMLLCDACDKWFHWYCLDEEDRCHVDEIDNDEIEWYCPTCRDEYADDNEWAKTHIVADDDMTTEECFTRSSCSCEVCASMNAAVDNWRTDGIAEERMVDGEMGRALRGAIDSLAKRAGTKADNDHFNRGLPPPKY